MKNGKALGPDRFNVDFFKACWNIVKKDIVEIVKDSRWNKTILKALNTSFISLIPKQDNAQMPERYKPIALCNVVYKIISKVVASRLKPLLPTLISSEQTGFVEGRQILDNIIQAHEVIHSLTCNKREGMIMKLDIAKAYDKVNWMYIKKVLPTFGFDHNWGIPTLKEALTYKQILNDFAKATGMEVNLSKSKVFFFNTHIAIQRNVSRILGFQRESLPSMYLGVPLTAKPRHKSIWDPLATDMQDKVGKWTNRDLNLAGRLVLTKAVLQAIPIFMLSALPAPIGVLQQFWNIQRDFLWGKEETRKKWALVSWENIYKPENQGGLRLDDPEILTKALGAKLWWRWVKDPKAQWESIWKEKYANA
eukprot:PITA_35804